MAVLQFSSAVSVVTGSGNGMGRSIAFALARKGGAVVVTDIAAEAARAVAEEIHGAGGTALAVQTDVADGESVQALADAAYDRFGKVDILVNNAGVTMRPFRSIWDASLKDFQWMMQVNYFGVVHGLRAFLPRMLQQSGHRHIVNTSSGITVNPVPGHAAYGASKAAVDAISDHLRLELADYQQDFGVTILLPGSVKTKIAERSENYRPEGERSAARDVKAYPFTRGMGAQSATALDANLVGDMVVRAIEANAPYVTTHAANVDWLTSRVEALSAGYFPAEIHQ